MARKHSLEVQTSALHQAIQLGIPLKQVAQEAGVSLSTLRRWIKAHGETGQASTSAPVPADPPVTHLHILLLDQEGIAPKLDSILRNEGYQPQLCPLAQHSLGDRVADKQSWLASTQVAELPLAGAVRLINLIERSGKDVPLLFLASGHVADLWQACTAIDSEWMTDQQLERLDVLLERLATRRKQRIQNRDCRLQYDQLRQCCYDVFDTSSNPIAILRDNGHAYANPAYAQLFNHADATTLKARDFFSLLGGKKHAAVAAMLESDGRGLAPVSIDISMRGIKLLATFTRFPGISRSVQVTLVPQNAASGQSGIAGMPSPLMSRPAWLQALAALGQNTERVSSALFYIRLLGFDQIQRAIGYAQSDALLTEISIALMSMLPERSQLTQLEGNVISALVQTQGDVDWMGLARRIFAGLTDRLFKCPAQVVRLRLTIGISPLAGQPQNSECFIIQAAEAASHAEQQSGIGLYNHGPADCDDPEQALWAGRVAAALKDDSLFSIVYQPIVNLNGGTEACYEALLRMHNESGGDYLPGKFLPAAQQAGLMALIDRWVMRHTARLIRTEAARGRHIRIFVNLSRDSLLSETFCDDLKQLLVEDQVDPQAFVFEAPESELLLYGMRCQPTLAGIRSLGCSLALDHFSGREEAFSLFESIDVDYIKFDAALVRGLAEGRVGRERVTGLAGNIAARGKQSIAGCVQNAESVALLWQCGVNYVQGYFLQQPSKALEYDFLNGEYEVTVSGKL